MEEGSKGGEICSKLFNLIPNGTDKGWKIQGCNAERSGHGISEEEKLELRLAPPGGEAWQVAVKKELSVQSLLPLGYLSKVPKNTSTDASSEAKRVFLGALEAATEGFQQQQQSEFLQLKARGKDLPQNTGGKEQQCLERRACDPSALPSSTVRNATTPINAQTRTATGPVVGWPPIRAFRKNLSSTSKSSPEPQNGSVESGKKQENNMMGAFVKINMDGIPIGRKVDLKAYDSYDKLSLAVDQLFRGLLAAQKDPLAAGSQNIVQGKHVITGILDGSGEYTLVYEDDEGDRMLVGDVPWDMFVSTAKRLRLLKSSELTASPLGAISRKRMANDG